jgi:hypothetical protein
MRQKPWIFRDFIFPFFACEFGGEPTEQERLRKEMTC